MTEEVESPATKFGKVVRHESTSLFTRGLIGIGVAYVCWTSNHIVNQFDTTIEKQGEIVYSLNIQMQRIAETINYSNRAIEGIQEKQAELYSELEVHHREPFHSIAGEKLQRLEKEVERLNHYTSD